MIGDLTHGTVVDLMAEPINPYDSEAVALFYQGKKVGLCAQTQEQFYQSDALLLTWGYFRS